MQKKTEVKDPQRELGIKEDKIGIKTTSETANNGTTTKKTFAYLCANGRTLRKEVHIEVTALPDYFSFLKFVLLIDIS